MLTVDEIASMSVISNILLEKKLNYNLLYANLFSVLILSGLIKYTLRICKLIVSSSHSLMFYCYCLSAWCGFLHSSPYYNNFYELFIKSVDSSHLAVMNSPSEHTPVFSMDQKG